MTESAATGSTIVVGVDCSKASEEALQWAFEEAATRSASVHVVLAWQTPVGSWVSPLGPASVLANVDRDYEVAAEDALAELLKRCVPGDPSVTVTSQVTRGISAKVLVGAASHQNAALLVVGSRGHGWFTGKIIGSVSEYCVANADCPVVVVRHKS